MGSVDEMSTTTTCVESVPVAERRDVAGEPRTASACVPRVGREVVARPDLGIGLLESGERGGDVALRDHARVGERLGAVRQRGRADVVAAEHEVAEAGKGHAGELGAGRGAAGRRREAGRERVQSDGDRRGHGAAGAHEPDADAAVRPSGGGCVRARVGVERRGGVDHGHVFLQGVRVIGSASHRSREAGQVGREGRRQLGFGGADAAGDVLVDGARHGVTGARASHDVAHEVGIAVGGRGRAEHLVERGAVGGAGSCVGESHVLGARALPHVGEHRLPRDVGGAEEAEVVVGELVGDAEGDADAVETAEDAGGCPAGGDRAEPQRQRHAVDGGLQLGDAQGVGQIRTEQLGAHIEQFARDRPLERVGGLRGQAVLHLHRGGRGEQGQQRRVQGEVAGEEADRGRLPIRRGIRDAVGAIAGLVHGEQVGPAVAQAVAVDEVVVQAEAEVQQLLGARRPRPAGAGRHRRSRSRPRRRGAGGGACRRRTLRPRRAAWPPAGRCRRSGTGRGASAPR